VLAKPMHIVRITPDLQLGAVMHFTKLKKEEAAIRPDSVLISCEYYSTNQVLFFTKLLFFPGRTCGRA